MNSRAMKLLNLVSAHGDDQAMQDAVLSILHASDRALTEEQIKATHAALVAVAMEVEAIGLALEGRLSMGERDGDLVFHMRADQEAAT